MGEPHPNLKFDYAAAQAVIDQAQSLISITRNQADGRVKRASNMEPNWKGHYADEFFQNEMPRMRSDAANLIQELQNLIKQMHAAIDTAHEFAQQNANWQQQNAPTPIPLGPGII